MRLRARLLLLEIFRTTVVPRCTPGSRRSRPLKETMNSHAFEFAVDDPERDIHLLLGHDFGKPLANKLGGTLKLRDTESALLFEASLGAAVLETTHGRDAMNMLDAGLVGGISPGFRVPDIDNAEVVIEENPAEGRALIRQVNKAVLFELSLVTRPAYPQTEVDKRSWELSGQATAKLQSHSRSASYRWRL